MQEVPACPQFAVSETPGYTRAVRAHPPLKRFRQARPVSQISKVAKYGGEVCTAAASLVLLLLENFSLLT